MSYKAIPAIDKRSINERFKALWNALSGSAGGAASPTLTEITYADLMTAIGAGTLVAGGQYLITDYATKHYIVDASGAQHLDTIITGVTEALIVMAISTNKISHEAKSILYPQDIIHYDPNPASWLQDLSFADQTDPVNPAIVTGFKGVIYFRHDTLLDNYMGYDFRNCKFRRWKTNCTAWNGVTAFVAGAFVNYLGFIYAAKQNSTNQVPADGSAYWMRVLDLSLTEYWNNKPTSTNNIPSDAASFTDVKTFSEGTGTATYELSCRSNHFDTFKDNNLYFDLGGTLLKNNVFFLQDNGTYQVDANEIGAENYANTVGNFFASNVIGNYFYANTIGNNFVGNWIASGCNYNLIGSSFLYNEIHNNLNSNTIGNSFQNNNVMDNSINGIDFSPATHVYAAYNCTLFKNSAGIARLSYTDGSDVSHVVNPNA